MPKVKADLSQAMTPNAPGTYVCRILHSEVKYGQSSGKPYMNWKLETLPEERTVFHSTPLEGRASGMYKHFIHSAGDTSYKDGEYDTDVLNGKLVSMKLTVDDRNYFVVKEVSPATNEQVARIPMDSKQRLQEVLEGDIGF